MSGPTSDTKVDIGALRAGAVADVATLRAESVRERDEEILALAREEGVRVEGAITAQAARASRNALGIITEIATQYPEQSFVPIAELHAGGVEVERLGPSEERSLTWWQEENYVPA